MGWASTSVITDSDSLPMNAIKCWREVAVENVEILEGTEERMDTSQRQQTSGLV